MTPSVRMRARLARVVGRVWTMWALLLAWSGVVRRCSAIAGDAARSARCSGALPCAWTQRLRRLLGGRRQPVRQFARERGEGQGTVTEHRVVEGAQIES